MAATKTSYSDHEMQKNIAELAQATLFMREKLKQSRQALADANIVVLDENKNVKKNQAFQAYQDLLKEYRASLKDLKQLTESKEDKAQPRQAPVQSIREKFKIA